MNEIIQSNPTVKETAVKYLKMLNFKFSEEAGSKFIDICIAFKLNPFKREIYGIELWDKKNDSKGLTIIVGYEVYLKRAEQTGKMDGWKKSVELDKNGQPLSATVIIYRKDWSHPFEHTVYMSEFGRKKTDGTYMSTWRDMPIFMLQKVGTAQAFRLCFPDEMGGLPYIKEEQDTISPKEDIPIELEPAKVKPIEFDPDHITLPELRDIFLNVDNPEELKKKMKEYASQVKRLPQNQQDELSTFCKNYKTTLQTTKSDPEF